MKETTVSDIPVFVLANLVVQDATASRSRAHMTDGRSKVP